jgi:hypothetical protein
MLSAVSGPPLGCTIRDGVLLRLIGKWLNAGVMEDGCATHPESGSPKGGVMTPPTTLQRTLVGVSLKRGWTDPIHDADVLLVDLDLLHQNPNDPPPRGPVPAPSGPDLSALYIKQPLLEMDQHERFFVLAGASPCPIAFDASRPQRTSQTMALPRWNPVKSFVASGENASTQARLSSGSSVRVCPPASMS